MTSKKCAVSTKPFSREPTSLTRVEQNDGFQAHKLLGLQLERAEAGGGGQQHVEDLHHPLHAVALVPVEGEGEGFAFD